MRATAGQTIGRADEPEGPAAGAVVVLEGVPWSGYESVLKWAGARPLRVTYDQGMLEIRSPSSPHEERRALLRSMVEIVLEEREIASRTLGSTTFKRKEIRKGLEPDECFYIENFARVRGRKRISLKTDPPPNLVIEVDVWASSAVRLGIYAAMGVPEVMVHRDGSIRFLRLGREGKYVASSRCRGLPGFDAAELTRWLARGEGQDHSAWRKSFRAWVRRRIDGPRARTRRPKSD